MSENLLSIILENKETITKLDKNNKYFLFLITVIILFIPLSLNSG